MTAHTHWIEPNPQGIYVRPANMWIDPSRPSANAIITHGHADHARGGHGHIIATPETLAIVELRYGKTQCKVAHVGDSFTINGVRFSLHPAGHVLGSAQVLMEYDNERVVVTGDFKRRHDPTCAAFELVPCDIFITEATFGLPVYCHPPTEFEIAKLLEQQAIHSDRCILIGAYALGKAQRVIAELRAAGMNDPIYLHGALEKMCSLYDDWGVELGDLRPVTDADRDDMRGQIVMCPPSALHDRWSRRLPDPVTAFASGWMRLRQRARQKNIEIPLVISDHADWNELTQTIKQLNPRETWITHGSEDGLLRWAELNQIKARALWMVGRDDEDDS